MRIPPGFAAAVATGAVLAGVVAGGGLVVTKLSGGDGGTGVTQLDTAGESTGADDGMVEQIPVSEQMPGLVIPDSLGGGFQIPDSFELPDIQLPDLSPTTGLPVTPGGPVTPGAPVGVTPPAGGTPAPAGSAGSTPTSPAPVCPTFTAPTTVKVNTVYPGSSSTVPVQNGTVRAMRPAFGPCSAETVVMDVVDGVASGELGYGAWRLSLDGANPATTWPAVAVTSTKAVSATAEAAGSCPTAPTKVKLTVNVRTVVLVPLLTPMALGQVKATPSGNGPCAPTESVTVPLDLLGVATVSLAPGTWTFTAVGKSVYSSTPENVVATDVGGTKSVSLIVK